MTAPKDRDELVELMARAVREAERRYTVLGTSDDDVFGGPPYRAPWHLIDQQTAEPEVNWPGNLVAEYDDGQAAYDHLQRLVAEAALEALEAAGCAVVPNEATEEMQIAGGLGVRVRAIAKDKLNAAIARSPYRREE